MQQASLQGKKIILGITGSIAAYKSALLCRLFIKAGAEVRVIMTPAATAFISPLTLSTLSKNEVWQAVLADNQWNNHVELGGWADALVIAPTTATTLAKLAHGICDNILTAVYLSAKCPVFIAPAMDLDMWKHPATQRNIALLQQDGNQLLPVGSGELASGLIGEGRMAEPEEIVHFLQHTFDRDHFLRGKKILITLGATYEAIDPVRFIGNRSTGKMGVELIKDVLKKGATVVAIAGPVQVPLPKHNALTVHKVMAAQEMYEKAMSIFPDVDIAILAAAVADYRPQMVATSKIKKSDPTLTIVLEKTPDIAKSLGEQKQAHQVIVGFALETDNELEHAKSKMERKNFDFIVLNSLKNTGAGFAHDTNQITLVHRADGRVETFPLKSKDAVADDIVAALRAYVVKE